ncbi:MAG: hypothetical protein Q9173_002435 [Seirophora scorigena]
MSPAELKSFLQNWPFFGLLHETLQDIYRHEDFVIVSMDNNGVEKNIITTANLSSRLEEFEVKIKKQDEASMLAWTRTNLFHTVPKLKPRGLRWAPRSLLFANILFARPVPGEPEDRAVLAKVDNTKALVAKLEGLRISIAKCANGLPGDFASFDSQPRNELAANGIFSVDESGHTRLREFIVRMYGGLSLYAGRRPCAWRQ